MRFLARLLLTLLRLALLVGLVYALVAVAWNDLLTRRDSFAITLHERERPAHARCGAPGTALELVELPGLPGNHVVVAGGPNPVSADAWSAFQPSLPWTKNSERHLLFDDSCFHSSPPLGQAPARSDIACSGDDCFRFREIDDYSWLDLAIIAATDCHPSSLGCLGPLVLPGHVSLTVIRKCHDLSFSGQVHVLGSDNGARFVMHATASGRPDISGPALPQGWSLSTVTLDEPLSVAPQGDACYHFILRDNLGQSYHQFGFRDTVYVTGEEL